MEDYLNTAPCGYFSFGETGLVIEANNHFCQLLQYSADEMIGSSIERFLTISSRIFYQTHFFPLLMMQGHSEEMFITLLSKNKEPVPVLVNSLKQHKSGITVYACAFIVVRQRKEFEDELLSARKNAELALTDNSVLQSLRDELLTQSERLEQQLRVVRQQNEELKQITRAVSHELQEPVRKISIFSQMLLKPPEKMDPHATLIRFQNSLERLRSVVSGIQRFLWLQEGTPSYGEVDIATIILETKEQLINEGNESIHLDLGKIANFYADVDQIRILCYQLLSNAIKFRKASLRPEMVVRGAIIRKNSFRELSHRYVYEEYVKIDFIDQGNGFDPAFRHQVLELFYRLAVDHGAGIGLALCKKIVDNHQGFLELHPKEGEGLTVSVLLPVLHTETLQGHS